MRPIVWLLRALVFFTLFAFALNNQHAASLHWFFGAQWQAPMVIIVLAAFAAGCAVGMLALAPRMWRRSRPDAGRGQHAASRVPETASADRSA